MPMPNWRAMWPGQGGENPPRFLRFRSSDGFIMFVVAFAVFTDIFLYGLIVPVAPTALHERVGLSVDEEQRWTSILLALYGAALLATSPIAGYMADRFESRYWPLIAGLVALGVSTALLCVGTSLALWIIGRLFQGASAAVVWTVGTALMVDTVGRDGLGQAMGYIGMGMTLGIMGGPLLGGIIYGRGGYYAVFGLAFGLVGFDIVLRLVMIEKKYAVRWQQQQQQQQAPLKNETQNPPRSPSSTSSSPSSASGTTETKPTDAAPSSTTTTQQPTPPSSPIQTPPKQKHHQQNPITTLLSSPRMAVTLWAYFIISVVLSSFDSVLPLFVEETFHWDQLGQGLIFIPISIPHILDPVVGYLNDKFPTIRRYLAAGALFATIPPMVAMRCVTDDTTSQKVLLCALLVLVGACIATLMPPVLVEASYIVQEKEERTPEIFGKGGAMALAYGILNVAFAAGTIVGPFFAGFIRESAGWGTMTWAMALLTGVSGIPVLLLLGGFLFSRKKDESGGGGGGQEVPSPVEV
ncbi:MFS transporter [Aspergillus homomorphus CBS 101889]|uniref:MFS general substrate transporter n=1 Tax=Aspergillus homomorphus (strain CBS 101889) TaxID=1450537 RepID=A0A395I573_ASPHC|nr:MFS general substrate transporter [Aspergillus homomorphus CBS 101889]RAL13504.1 MFS general substrate transporter [Aspergillus homomorphus CBS 101889]